MTSMRVVVWDEGIGVTMTIETLEDMKIEDPDDAWKEYRKLTNAKHMKRWCHMY